MRSHFPEQSTGTQDWESKLWLQTITSPHRPGALAPGTVYTTRNAGPTTSFRVGCMRQALGPGALGKPRGSGWRGRWEGGSGWGTHVNPWLFHSNVWQNSLQINKFKKKKSRQTCHPDPCSRNILSKQCSKAWKEGQDKRADSIWEKKVTHRRIYFKRDSKRQEQVLSAS